MDFNNYSKLNLTGTHAFLSPSNYHWLGYTEDKLDHIFHMNRAAQRGVRLHALAHDLIREKVRLPEQKTTLNMYVNDALGYRMTPELFLYFSHNCYGTADALSYHEAVTRDERDVLRIHDLKTGVNEASVHQLEVYAGIFCLEYNKKPNDIEIELRIYQNDKIQIFAPEPDVIFHVMDRIIVCDQRIDELKTGGRS